MAVAAGAARFARGGGGSSGREDHHMYLCIFTALDSYSTVGARLPGSQDQLTRRNPGEDSRTTPLSEMDNGETQCQQGCHSHCQSGRQFGECQWVDTVLSMDCQSQCHSAYNTQDVCSTWSN